MTKNDAEGDFSQLLSFPLVDWERYRSHFLNALALEVKSRHAALQEVVFSSSRVESGAQITVLFET